MLLKITKKALLGLLAFTLLVLSFLLLSVPYSKIDDYELPLPVENPSMAVTNTRVVNPTDGSISLATILIEDGKVLVIQDNADPIPEGFIVKDVDGAYVIPGLIDLHTHVFDKSDLSLSLVYGVTSVRNMMGFPMHLRWREQIRQGELLGPELYTASPTINHGGNSGPFHKQIDSAEEIEPLVIEYKNAGYDLIKFYDGLTTDQYETLVGAAQKWKINIAGHPPRDVDFDQLLASKPATLEHVEELYQGELDYEKDEKLATELAEKIAASGVTMVPTLSAYHHIRLADENPDDFFSQQRRQYINPLIQLISERQLSWINEESYSKRIKAKDEFLGLLVTKLDQAGASMALGTDTGPSMTIPGKTVLDEMDLYKAYGLSNQTILRMATVNAARALGQSDHKGSLQAGKDADMIVLTANPLDQLSTLREPLAVVRNGQWLSPDDLQLLRQHGTQHYSVYHTLGLFLEHVFSK